MEQDIEREPIAGLLSVRVDGGNVLLTASTLHPAEDRELEVSISLLDYEADWLIEAIRHARSRHVQ